MTNPRPEQLKSNFRRLLPPAPNLPNDDDAGDPQKIIIAELKVLEAWASSNLSASRRDFVRYWIMKVPALLCGLGVAGAKQLGLGDTIVAVLGLVSTFLISVDAVWPGGLAFNAHRRAASEIRRLQMDSSSAWNEAKLMHGSNPDKLRASAIDILRIIRDERTRIDQQITAAETSLDRKSEQ
jgi:hypothetical protein